MHAEITGGETPQPGSWEHAVDTFTFSKMRTDQLDVCENVAAACGKTRLQPPLPSPTQSPPLPGSGHYAAF